MEVASKKGGGGGFKDEEGFGPGGGVPHSLPGADDRRRAAAPRPRPLHGRGIVLRRGYGRGVALRKKNQCQSRFNFEKWLPGDVVAPRAPIRKALRTAHWAMT